MIRGVGLRRASPHGGTVLWLREKVRGPLSVPGTAGASLRGGPESAWRRDRGAVWFGVPLGLQGAPLLLGATGYRYSQVIKSIN